MHKVLILCTGNSARSVIAEVLLNHFGGGGYQAFSAGSEPAGAINPGAVRVLEAHGHSVEGLRSKSWDEFSGVSAPNIDTVITVCDNAAAESCPVWNGAPETLHWGLPDPAAVANDAERAAAFQSTYAALSERVRMFVDGSRSV
ncbi:MAG: arsenate reductase ArsC [Woeseiaceae bacterium]